MTVYSLRDELLECSGEGRSVLAFTGAGISVESGIPDFRSPSGLWKKYPPEEYGSREAFLRNPEKVWNAFLERAREWANLRPHQGHEILAKWEKRGLVQGVITQNVDGFHQMAGSERVWELHGSLNSLVCLGCSHREERLFHEMTSSPHCPQCSQYLRPDMTLFGDPLPLSTWESAKQAVQDCDFLLVIGTSGVVHPAAELPRLAFESGATLGQINLESTGLTHQGIVRYFVEGPAGSTLARVDELIESSP